MLKLHFAPSSLTDLRPETPEKAFVSEILVVRLCTKSMANFKSWASIRMFPTNRAMAAVFVFGWMPTTIRSCNNICKNMAENAKVTPIAANARLVK